MTTVTLGRPGFGGAAAGRDGSDTGCRDARARDVEDAGRGGHPGGARVGVIVVDVAAFITRLGDRVWISSLRRARDEEQAAYLQSLEPHAHSERQLRSSGRLALGLGELGRAGIRAVPRHADVGRELPPELIPEPQARVGRAQPRPDPALRVRLAVDLRLPGSAGARDDWSAGARTRSRAEGACGRRRRRRPSLLPRTSTAPAPGCQPRPTSARARPHILTDTDHDPTSARWPAVERVRLRRLETASFSVALRPEPEAIEVAADPAVVVPAQAGPPSPRCHSSWSNSTK